MQTSDYTELSRSHDCRYERCYDYRIDYRGDDLSRQRECLWLTRFCQYIRFPGF